jgi:hypothetical protein
MKEILGHRSGFMIGHKKGTKRPARKKRISSVEQRRGISVPRASIEKEIKKMSMTDDCVITLEPSLDYFEKRYRRCKVATSPPSTDGYRVHA